MLVEELEVEAGAAVRQTPLAASDEHRHEEQVQLVDERRLDRLGPELRAADGEVAARRRLPELRELLHVGGLRLEVGRLLPEGHRLVHAATVEVGPDAALE